MSDINLLPGEDLGKKGPFGKFLLWVLTYGRYIIIGTEIIVLLAFFSRFKLDRDLTDLHQAIVQKEAIIASSRNFENEVRQIQNRLTIIKGLQAQRKAPLNLLSDLSRLMPEDVSLTDLIFENNKISLTATSLTNDSFNNFLDKVGKLPQVTDVSLEDIGKNQKGPGVEFHLSANLKN